jgi:hypothetical protein
LGPSQIGKDGSICVDPTMFNAKLETRNFTSPTQCYRIFSFEKGLEHRVNFRLLEPFLLWKSSHEYISSRQARKESLHVEVTIKMLGGIAFKFTGRIVIVIPI